MPDSAILHPSEAGSNRKAAASKINRLTDEQLDRHIANLARYFGVSKEEVTLYLETA